MEMQELDRLKSTVEEELKKIIQKGTLSPTELENADKALCVLEHIQILKDGDETGEYSGRSYARRMYDDGSYRRGRNMRGEFMSRNSYDEGYRDGLRDRGRSGHSIKDRMVARLEQMIDEAQGDHEKKMVEEWIRKIEAER